MGRNYIDIAGQQFGRLTAIKIFQKGSAGNPIIWECKCICGNISYVRSNTLRALDTISCGCWRKESCRKIALKHGLCESAAHKSWSSMMSRCYGKDPQHLKYYEGIKVCKKWHTFTNFYKDMGDPPKGHTIHRLDNSKGYSSDNCVWASRHTQQRNKRSNYLVTYKGTTKCIAEWAEEFNLEYETLRSRLKYMGWRVHDALTTPSLNPRK